MILTSENIIEKFESAYKMMEKTAPKTMTIIPYDLLTKTEQRKLRKIQKQVDKDILKQFTNDD